MDMFKTKGLAKELREGCWVKGRRKRKQKKG
jgi:hypothetical protein